MAGQIIKRGERLWLVRVYAGREKAPDGTLRKKYIGKTVHGTKKDAQALLNDWLRKKDLHELIEPSRMTLNEYLDRWLEDVAKAKLRERTYAVYEWNLKRYVRPALGSRKLREITPLDIQGLYTEMLSKGLSARTVRYVHAVLSSALKQAVRWRMLIRNPAEAVDLPKQDRKEMRALTEDEVAKFVAAAASDRCGPVFLFALATGMRPSEYLGLQWQDVDLRAGTVTVRRVVVQRAGTWRYTEPKTSRSRRTIPLPASITRLLREHFMASPFKAPTDPVFASHEGRPLDEHSTVRRRFKAVLKKAGLPSTIRLYDLRHTCATLLLVQGVNPKVVSERLGHASITLTLDTYSHVLPTMQQEAAERLEAVLSRRDTPATHLAR
ncbi:MAG TPA: site-specific integrase [Thermodesulfobacteriota bacterium]